MHSRLSRPIGPHPLWVWLLWAAVVAAFAASPMLLADPAMWFYVLDPELLALLAVVGWQMGRLQLGVVRLQLMALLRASAFPGRDRSRR
jgi:hypothetical protein